MNKTTTPQDAAEWADAQTVRHERKRWPYIPQGCDQQGRLTPTLDDAKLAPAEELQAEPQRKPLPSQAGRFWLGYVAFIAAVALAGVLTLINQAPKP